MDAINAWSFLPLLAATIGYGEIRLSFHDGQLRDLEIDLKAKPKK